MSRYGNKTLSSVIDSIVNQNGRYGSKALILDKTIKPMVLRGSIDFVNNTAFARSDIGLEVYLENDQSLFIDIENHQIKTDI